MNCKGNISKQHKIRLCKVSLNNALQNHLKNVSLEKKHLNVDSLDPESPNHSINNESLNNSDHSDEIDCQETDNRNFEISICKEDELYGVMGVLNSDREIRHKTDLENTDLKEFLRSWANIYNVSHSSLNALLPILKHTLSHDSDLPVSAKALLRKKCCHKPAKDCDTILFDLSEHSSAGSLEMKPNVQKSLSVPLSHRREIDSVSKRKFQETSTPRQSPRKRPALDSTNNRLHKLAEDSELSASSYAAPVIVNTPVKTTQAFPQNNEILTVLQGIYDGVKNITEKLNIISNTSCCAALKEFDGSTSSTVISDILPFIPCRTLEEFDEMEEIIEEKENRPILVRYFRTLIGGVNASVLAVNIMKNLLSNEVGMEFNWFGQANKFVKDATKKRAFVQTKTWKCLLEFFQLPVNQAMEKKTEKEIKYHVQKWLENSKARASLKKKTY